MPSFVTHYYFGKMLLERVKLDDAVKKYPIMFNMGCQGPDLYFYYMDSAKPDDKSIPPNTIGTFLHNHLIYEQFVHILNFIREHKDNERFVSYAYGLLCHYALDSVAHPFIYYMQEEGLPPFYPEKKQGALHILYETRLDNYVFHEKLHKSIKKFSNAVRTEKEDRESIAAFQKGVFDPMLNAHISEKSVIKAAKFFKTYQNVFDDPTKILPTLLKGISAMASYPSKVYGFIHPSKVYNDREDWFNTTRRHWPRCRKEDEVVNWTFDEVLEHSVDRAEDLFDDFNNAFYNGGELDPTLYTVTYDGNRAIKDETIESALKEWNDDIYASKK